MFRLLREILVVSVFCGLFLFVPQTSQAEDYVFLKQGPDFTVTTNGVDATLSWTNVQEATGYRLYYAPYPYAGPSTLASINLGDITERTYTLFDGASYIAAVKAYNENGESGFSNVELVQTYSPGINCDLSTNVTHQSVSPSHLSNLMSADGLNQILTGPYIYRVAVNAGGGYYTSTSMQMCLSSEPQSGWALGTSDATEVQRTQIGDDSSLQNLFKFNNLGWQEVSSTTQSNDLYMRLDSKWGANIDTYITYWFETDQPINQLGYKLLDDYSDDFGSISIQGFEINDSIGIDLEDQAISNAYIQWRNYEDSRDRFRGWVSFGTLTLDEVSTITLKNESGSPVVSSVSYSYYSAAPYSQASSEEELYNPRIVSYEGLSLYFDDLSTLPAGNYVIEIFKTDGTSLTQEIYFPGKIVLPAPDSSEMAVSRNYDGSVSFNWGVVYTSDPFTYRMILANEFDEELLIVDLPNYSTEITIPASVIEQAIDARNPRGVKWTMQTRHITEAGVNAARGISTSRVIPWRTTHIKWWPINEFSLGDDTQSLPAGHEGIDIDQFATRVLSSGVALDYYLKGSFFELSNADDRLGGWFDMNKNDQMDDGDGLLVIGQSLNPSISIYPSGIECAYNLSVETSQSGDFVSVLIDSDSMDACGIGYTTPMRVWGHSNEGFTNQYPNVFYDPDQLLNID